MKKYTVILLALVLLSACGGNYVARIGDEELTKGEFNFYLSSIKNQMAGTELASDEDWQTQEIEGRKAIDVAKDRALEAAAENIAYIEVGDYLKVDLSESEEDMVDMLENNLVSQYGGKANFNVFLKAQGIDEDFIEMLCEAQVYSDKLAKMAVEKNPITDAERDAKFSELIQTKYKAKHILFATIDQTTRQKLSDDEIETKKVKANDVYKQVMSGADFDTLMNNLSEDPGLQTSPGGYVFGPGEMVAEFESTTAALGENEIGFVESDFGYHIIKRLPVTREDLSEEIEYSLSMEKLSKAMTEWKQLAGIKIIKNENVFEEIM